MLISELREIKTDLKYDIYKWIVLGAGGLMLAAAYAIYQKVRHISVDWYVFVGLFVLSLVILAAAMIASKRGIPDNRSRGAKDDTEPSMDDGHRRMASDAAKKLVIHSALYGAGEITDVAVTDRLNAAVRDALVIPVNNNLISGSPDPAPNQPKRLEVTYSYGTPNRHTVSRPEHARLVLPEDSEIQRLASEVQRMTQQLTTAKASVVVPAKPSIEILAPVNNAEVGPRRSVLGSVQSLSSVVQVLVYALDKWHLQGSAAEVDGFAWKVDCHFGIPESGLGKDFKIIAIADGKISGGPFLSLPTTGVPSEVVNVRRRH